VERNAGRIWFQRKTFKPFSLIQSALHSQNLAKQKKAKYQKYNYKYQNSNKFCVVIPILNISNTNMHQFLHPTHFAKRTLRKTTSPRPPSEHFQINLQTKA